MKDHSNRSPSWWSSRAHNLSRLVMTRLSSKDVWRIKKYSRKLWINMLMRELKANRNASQLLKNLFVLEAQMDQSVYMTTKSRKSSASKTNLWKDSQLLVLTLRELTRLRIFLLSAGIVKVKYQYMRLRVCCSIGRSLRLSKDRYMHHHQTLTSNIGKQLTKLIKTQ